MSHARDLTGYISGDLVVIERDYDYPTTLKSKNPPVYWKCKCKCGTIITVSSSRLTTNNARQKATSCHQCAFDKRRIDITGQQFGKLTAIEIARDKHIPGDSHTIWKCLCECGNITYVPINHLKSGATKSCGCLQRSMVIDDLTGLQFGKLIVLKQVPRPEHLAQISRAYWLCQCECGNQIILRSSALKDMNGTQSCGCVNSKGELKIIQLLQANNIKYEYQKSFPTCIFPFTNAKARFDFYINNSFLLEFDGKQHYNVTFGWNTEEHLQNTIKRDEYKNQWCKKNNIPLKRIPYWKLNDLTINDILGDQYIVKEETNE